jgi:hypothetical protein
MSPPLDLSQPQTTPPINIHYNISYLVHSDRLCGLVVKVPGYLSYGPGFESRALQEKKSSESGTGSTQPREYNWGANWKK